VNCEAEKSRSAAKANIQVDVLIQGCSSANNDAEDELETEVGADPDTAYAVMQDDANDGTIGLADNGQHAHPRSRGLHGGLARRADRPALRRRRLLPARVGDLPDVRGSVHRNVPDQACDVSLRLESGVRLRRE